MRRKILAVALAVLSIAFPLQVSASGPDYAEARKTTHLIVEHTIVGGGAQCSGTAIGPHALLTASHCEQPTSVIMVDEDEHVKVLGLVRDGNDHTIYFVDATFKYWSPIVLRSPEIGEDVFIFGNPGKFEDILRKGYVANVMPKDIDGPEADILDMNGWYGDSGAAVFDADGNIIGIVSVVLVQNKDGVSQKFVGCIAFGFSKEVLEAARKGK
jgi:hypothetical protein